MSDLRVTVAAALPLLVTARFSDPIAGEIASIRVRPVQIKGVRLYQFESRVGARALHRNLEEANAVAEILNLLRVFRQAVLATEEADIHLRGTRASSRPKSRAAAPTSHNRAKSYLIQEGAPVAFLARLGVMNGDGKVFASKQDKFRQMNRYLEFVDDVLPVLPKGPLKVVDFGCGKSYLTFALHHLLREVRGLEAEIVGLDLRQDLVENCAQIARDLKLKGLRFERGDIAGFKGVDRADLVVSLHACDTATDEALAKAVAWHASAILAVPCCQHEVAKSISGSPLLKHGILKERIAALVTDAMRAELLETAGYETQIVEFIDTEHTPKNLLIRAVRRGSKRDPAGYHALKVAWGAGPALEGLLA